MKSSKKILTAMVVAILFAMIVAIPVEAGEKTTDSQGRRHLVVIDEAKSSTSIANNISANLTLEETIGNNYSASFKMWSNSTSAHDVYLNLTISNSTISSTNSYHNATFGDADGDTDWNNESFWVNYSDGDYDANLTLTIDGEDHDWKKVNLRVSQLIASTQDAIDILVAVIPVIAILAILMIIFSALSDIGSGGGFGGGW